MKTSKNNNNNNNAASGVIPRVNSNQDEINKINE